MSKSKIHGVFYTALKGLISAALKLFAIILSWTLKLCGMILTKLSEAIERVLLKNS